MNSADEARAAYANLGGQACVLEKCSTSLEVSAIVTRVSPEQLSVFPVAENIHKTAFWTNPSCRRALRRPWRRKRRQMARQLAEALDYGRAGGGVFVLADDSLVINEIALRPHNSGHYTIDACVSDQYQQQAPCAACCPAARICCRQW